MNYGVKRVDEWISDFHGTTRRNSSFKDPDYTVLCRWLLMVRATRKEHSGSLRVLWNIPLSMKSMVHFLIGVLSFRRHHYKLFGQKLVHQNPRFGSQFQAGILSHLLHLRALRSILMKLFARIYIMA